MTDHAQVPTTPEVPAPPMVGPRVFAAEIASLCYATMLNLRGNASDPAFIHAMQEASGLLLPTAINGVSRSINKQWFCHGPDEWVFYQTEADTPVFKHLGQLLQGQVHSLVDTSSGFEHLSISGADAYLLLQTGCPLDLHPGVFKSGRMAQSHFHKANITIYCVEAGTRFELTVRRSFARYLRDYLQASLG